MNEVPSCTCSCAQSEISGHEPSSQSIQELEHKLSRRNALVAGATATAGALALSACAEGSSFKRLCRRSQRWWWWRRR